MSNGRYSASVDQLSQHLLPSAARRRDQPSTRSPALRYWNLAQQRHYRRSVPCRRAMPVSGDCAACHGPHTRGKRPGFRPRQANSRERRTVCWREPDSNFRYLSQGAALSELGFGPEVSRLCLCDSLPARSVRSQFRRDRRCYTEGCAVALGAEGPSRPGHLTG